MNSAMNATFQEDPALHHGLDPALLQEAEPDPAYFIDEMDDEPVEPVENEAEARDLLAHLTDTMDGLGAVIESETRLVRAAMLSEASALHDDKHRLLVQYRTLVRAMRENGDTLRLMLPERMDHVRHRHDGFRESVMANLATLKAARDVSENLVRSVSAELHEASANTPYSEKGKLEEAPKTTPLTIDKPA